MDRAVTVVEWGRGRVEHLSESRLEVDLHRAIGLGRRGRRRNRDPPATTATVLDFDTEDDDEPRTIVMRGFGPRWSTEALVLGWPHLRREP